MKSEVSALVDGELEEHEARRAFAAMRQGDELQAAWSTYLTIGAALRRENGLSHDITSRVMAGLEQEPTVLSPQAKRETAWPRPALALAASAAGVAVVAWVAFAPQFAAAPARGELARGSAEPATVVAMKPAAQREMQEYLAAHQAYASSAQLPRVTQNIRTVSASGGVSRQ